MDNEADRHQEELMRGVASGDEASFVALYDCFSRSLYALGLRTLGDPGRAEELVQETMTKVWRSAGSFDPAKGRVSPWIFAVARRTTVDLIRQSARTAVPVESLREIPDARAADAQEWRDWEIGVLLSSLPAGERMAVEMFVIEGYTHVEVAESLKVPLGTIKTRIYTGLKRLREHIEKLEMLGASS